ncbi:hypothetical protein D3C81_922760 [compost metagenome]
MGEALDAHDRRPLFHFQCLGQVAVGQDRIDGQVSVTKRDAAVVFQQQENVAGNQVGFFQFFPHSLWQPGQLQ